ALVRFPGTLVFYMAIARCEAIVTALLAQDKPADTPAAVVERGSTAAQRTFVATLTELPAVIARENIQAPALLVVGDVVSLRRELAWFEDRPLFGKTVLITRPRHQADDLVRQVEALGGSAVVLPVVQISEPEDWSAVDEALARLRAFDWLVFTSS